MNTVLKGLISEHINTVEELSKEIKSRQEEIKELVKVIKTKEGEETMFIAAEHQSLSVYTGLLYSELKNHAYSVVALYNYSLLANEKLEFLAEELEIINTYVNNFGTLFIKDKGKIISKQEKLIEVMAQKAKEKPELLEKYITTI